MTSNKLKLIASIKTAEQGKSRPDQTIYQQIFDAILSQNLLPETKLPEAELAEIFAVSRTLVRSALQRLAHSRIIEIIPNKGAVVASYSAAQAKEILAARRLIEGAIIKSAIAAASPSQLQALRAMVTEEQNSFEHDNRGSGIRLSGDFHLSLAEVSGNTTLLEFMRVLVPQTSLIIAQYEKPGYANCSHEEHFALLEVIEAGDSDQAMALMEQHLQGIEDKLHLVDRASQIDLQRIFAKQ